MKLLRKWKKNRDRVESRNYEASENLPENVKADWKGAKTALKVTRQRDIKGKISVETVFVLTSLSLSDVGLKKIAGYIRTHWYIENKLHYVRDVTMGEDKSRIRKGNGSQLFASMRNIVLSLFRLNNVKNVAEEIRRLLYHPLEYAKYLNGKKLL